MKRNKFVRRWMSVMLALIMVFVNIGSSVSVALGSTLPIANFTMSADSLVRAVEEIWEQGREPVSKEDLNFVLGEVEQYEQVFFSAKNQKELYECYPEYECSDSDVQLRTFIWLPGQLEDGYELTGEESLLFLYINHSDITVNCSITLTNPEGEDVETKLIKLASYSGVFEDRDLSETETADLRSGSHSNAEGATGSNAKAPKSSQKGLVGLEDGSTAKYFKTSLSQLQIVASNSHPGFSQTLYMEDGMIITIAADEGILPAGVEATAEPVPDKEALVREAMTDENMEVTASPIYDINLWLHGDKLDNDSWSENGHVRVSFSGDLMEEISQSSDQIQVVWVKDEGNSPGQSPKDLVELVSGTKTIINEGKDQVESLSWDADHFTLYGPMGTTFPNGNNRVFAIEDLLDEEYPQMKFETKDGDPLGVTISETNEITLVSGKPLPRDAGFSIQLSYGLANSSVKEDHDYAVQPGDQFTFAYPSNVSLDINSLDVKDNEEIIGNGTIRKQTLTLTITKQNVGIGFQGTVDVSGAVDWSKVDEGSDSVKIQLAGIEYTIVFEPQQTQKPFSVSVSKSHDEKTFDPTTDSGDVKYDEQTGFPSALRFHLTVTADETNSDVLTFGEDVYLYDLFTKFDEYAYFDVDSFKVTANNMEEHPDNTVETAACYNYINPANTHYQRIYLKDFDNQYASLLPGQAVTVSYWIQLSPEIWSKTFSYPESDSSLRLENTVSVIQKGKTLAEDVVEVIFSKNKTEKVGNLIEIDGEVACQYYVFVNPDNQDLNNWRVKDEIDQHQKYGQLTVYAYPNVEEYLDPTQPADGYVVDRFVYDENMSSWEYRIRPEYRTYYHVFEYATYVKGTPDELTNNVTLIAPNNQIMGGDSTKIPYGSYSLTKQNMNTKMQGNRPIYHVGWEDGMGKINWKSEIFAYQDGDSKKGTIEKGHTYTDSLDVVNQKGDSLDKSLVALHSFKDTEKLNLVVTDGDENQLTKGEDYSLTCSDDARSFTVKFETEVKSPVTLSYASYVDDFVDFGEMEVLFKNQAELIYGNQIQKADAYQPYASRYYLQKDVEINDADTGIVVWNLYVNKGYNDNYKMRLQNREIDIVEELPPGMELLSITYDNNALTEGEGYEWSEGNIIIHLNKIEDFMKSKEDFDTKNIQVHTKITDPSSNQDVYVNKATMYIDGKELSKAHAQVLIEDAFLEKNMEYNQQTAPVAYYSLLVNKPGARISEFENGTLEISDRLGHEAMSYVSLDQFQILNAKTREKITQAERKMAADGRSFTITNLPDETPILIQYQVAFSGNIGETLQVENSAILSYSYEKQVTVGHEAEVVIKRASATGTGKPYIVIHKQDQNGNALEGAEFTLYKMIHKNGEWIQGEVVDVYQPSGVDASVIIKSLDVGQIYYLLETKVPNGYEGASGIYFAITGDTAITEYPHGTQLWSTGIDYTFVNTKISGNTGLTGRKTLVGRRLVENEFMFDVYEDEKLITTGTNLADGTIVFEKIAYTEADIGTHFYTISERAGNLSNVTYDPTVYLVVLQVAVINDQIEAHVIKTMLANETSVDEVVFRNRYNPPGGDGGDGGGGGGGGTGRTSTILPEAVPLAPAPTPGEEDLTEIMDEEVPLAGLPKTGDRARSGIRLLVLSFLFVVYGLGEKKKKEEK